jgi:superfamily II DNA or RNA helicase
MSNLYKHQIEFLKENPDKSALVWSCGTGKTRTALEWANTHNYNSPLIICPKALKANWKREAERNCTNCLVVTKEEFRRDWKNLLSHGQIIVDEVHNGFLTPNFKSQMSKALRDYIKLHNVPRILLLSATVYTSSPWNIYQLATLLGHKWNWKSFNYTFFDQIRMGMRVIPQAKKGVEKKLAELTKKIASVVNIYDVLDVPLQQHCEPEYFALTKEQQKAIEQNYDPLPIVRYTQQHEIENGILLANEFRELQTYETDKEERIKAICEENKKVAIVCRYNAQIDSLRESLQSLGKQIMVIRGDIKDRDIVTRTAEQSEECIVLIQADCAEGYELPSFPLCVFASMSYSYTKWEQICGRFLRMNKPSCTTFIYLLTEGESVDQGVYDAVKRKEDFKIELFKK